MCAQGCPCHLTPSHTPLAQARAREQAAGGLRVTGFMAKHATCNGLYTRSQADPDANGFPHYISTKGMHIYVQADGQWGIDDELAPATSDCWAHTPGGDTVPTGETTWQYLDHGDFVDRALTVTELSKAEVAVETEKALVAKEAVRPTPCGLHAPFAGGKTRAATRLHFARRAAPVISRHRAPRRRAGRGHASRRRVACSSPAP